jgi:ADP-heptose:LPS heptosyltransferase
VAVIHTGALGDFVLTWPLLAAVRRRFPGAALTVVGHAARAGLARKAAMDDARPLADAVESLDGPTYMPLFGEDRSGDDALRRRFADCAAVVSLLGPADSHFHRRLREVFAGRLWTVDTRPEPGLRLHITEQWARQVPDLVGETPVPRFRRIGTGTLPQGTVVIHPGSGGRAKCWPTERFAETARLLSRPGSGLRPVFIVGEVERERGLLPPDGFEVLPDGSLDDLAGRLSAASAFVGNDSGPAHLAAALGTPTVAVFRATDPLVWGPRGLRVKIVGQGEPSRPAPPPGACPWGPSRGGRGPADPSPDEVASAVAELLRG